MKKVLFLFIILATSIGFASRIDNAKAEMQVPARLDLIKIDISSQDDVKTLDNLGVIINQVRDGYCIGEASPSLISFLEKKNYSITTLQENISGQYYDNFFTEDTRGRYLTYTEFIDTMHVIAANNPSICKLETLCLSHQSRLVLALKISDTVDVDENEPAIYFDGNIHGDEKIGWAVCFEFVKFLLNNYGFNAYVANLINNREIWIVPMLNPDGYVNNIRYNGRSVDLNRNFSWMWGNESSCGADAFSENEATAFSNLFVKHPFVIYTTYHAGDSIISNPWSYTSYDSIPEKFVIWYLSQGYSQRGNNYPYGQGAIVMYYINGASKDYVYGIGGEVGWSIELHNTKTPPATAIDPTFNINKDAMLWLCHKAGQGIHGMITDSITGESLYAQIWVQPRNWLSYSSPTKGDFHRFYLPGTYTVIAKCPGYKDDTNSITIPNTGDSTVTLDIKMIPDSSAVSNYAIRVVSSRYVTQSSNRTYPVRVLGLHDTVSYKLDNTKWIVLAMAKPIQNDSGYDFTVFRQSGTGTATVKVSHNWKGPWTTIGTANAAQTHFDLGTVSFDTARYVRLDASGTFNLDAIEKYYFTSGIEADNVYSITNDFNIRLHSNLVNSSLQISYANTLGRDIKICIYDAAGRNVRTLTFVNGNNEFIYNLRNNNGELLNNGVYFIKISDLEKPVARFTVIR